MNGDFSLYDDFDFSKFLPRVIVKRLMKLNYTIFIDKAMTKRHSRSLEELPFRYSKWRNGKLTYKPGIVYDLDSLSKYLNRVIKKYNLTYQESMMTPYHKTMLEIIDKYKKLLHLHRCKNIGEIVNEITSMVEIPDVPNRLVPTRKNKITTPKTVKRKIEYTHEYLKTIIIGAKNDK